MTGEGQTLPSTRHPQHIARRLRPRAVGILAQKFMEQGDSDLGFVQAMQIEAGAGHELDGVLRYPLRPQVASRRCSFPAHPRS